MIYSLTNFQICRAVLLTIATMLYIISLGLIYFIMGKFVPSDPFSPFHLPPHHTSGNHWSALCICACMLSHFSHIQLLLTLRTVTRQPPLSLEFPRQEYWSGLSFLPSRDLPNPGVEPASPALQADSLAPSHRGSPLCIYKLGFPYLDSTSKMRSYGICLSLTYFSQLDALKVHQGGRRQGVEGWIGVHSVDTDEKHQTPLFSHPRDSLPP